MDDKAITHEQAQVKAALLVDHGLAGASDLLAYITQQQARETADAKLLEQALETLSYVGVGRWYTADLIRTRLGKEVIIVG